MNIGYDLTTLIEKKRTGISNYAYNLFINVVNLYKDYKFISLGIIPLKAYDTFKNLAIAKKDNVFLKTYRMPSRLWTYIFRLWSFISFPPIEFLAGNVDIFHSFDWYFPPAKSCKRLATIFDISTLLYPEGHTVANIAQHTNRLKAIKREADFVLTISQFSKKEIIRVLGIPEEKIEIAYPGVDTKTFIIRKNFEVRPVLSKYGLKPGFLLFVGSWYPRKNLKRLIKVFKYFKTEYSFKNKLVLIGRKTSLIDSLDLNSSIVSLGYVSQKDLPYFYNGASCFIYPSLYEGFGIPLLEAMASGCPVVTSNLSSMPEVIDKAGVLVDPYKEKSIFKGIKKVLENKRFASDLKTKGLKRAGEFTWKNCARKTFSVYKKVVQ
jgi:glycosyltransferase involved in cell wall biosynthesis